MITTFTIIHTVLLLLLLLLLCFTCSVSQTAVAVCDHIHHNRRLLHQPFFAVTSSIPPVEPPAVPPEPEPHSQQPKYPFSSSSTPNWNPQTPFFPKLPSPPPPPLHFTTTLPTFPANISSLLFPHSSSSSSTASSRRDIIVISVSITLSLLLIATLASLSAFFLHSRRLHHRTTTTPDKAPGSESLRLFPPDTIPSDGSPPSKPPRQRGGVSSTSSEFLYLGTLVNSRASVEAHERAIKNLSTNTGAGGGGGGVSSSSPCRRLGSPELNPLPPLPKFNSYTPMYRSGEALLNNSCNKKENVDDRYLDGGDDDDDDDDDDAGDDEFFSPRGSSGRKESSPVVHRASGSRRDFRGLQGEPFGSTSFNSRTASYPHPDSSSPVNNNSVSTSPSVVLSNVSARSSESDEDLHTIAGLRAAVRPMKQSSPSVLSCSTGADSGDTKNSPVRNSRFVEHHRFVAPTARFDSVASDQAMPTKLPPPPPPLPPQGLWDVPVGERTAPEVCLGPPVLVAPSRSVLVPNAIHGAVNYGSVVERNEEIPRPKLKPLHWDKVRASSDRVMVWDQIKSSSFQ